MYLTRHGEINVFVLVQVHTDVPQSSLCCHLPVGAILVIMDFAIKVPVQKE